MKRIIIAGILLPIMLISGKCNGQDNLQGVMPNEDGRVIYTKIIEIENASKNKLFAIIKDWAVNSYKSEKSAAETEDKEVGYIAYKGYFEYIDTFRSGLLAKGKPYSNKAYHTLKFYIKDNKLKIVMSDIEVATVAMSAYTVSEKRVPIETWHIEDNNEKRRAKGNEAIQLSIRNIHQTILSLFESIEKNIRNKSKKSEFDF